MIELHNAFIEVVRVTILIALPILVALLVGGLLSSLIQTFTVIGEPVIGHATKLLALVITLYFMLPSFSRTLVDFTVRLYGQG